MYVREVGKQVLTFQVSGKLWNRSLVMRDVETGSEWSHILGRCMAGPLKGKELRPLISDLVTWGHWRRLHPRTTVLNMSRTAAEYTREFYSAPSLFVFGFVVGGSAWHIPMAELQQRKVWQFEANGQPLVATFHPASAGVHLFSVRTPQGVLHFEFDNEKGMIDRETRSRWDPTTGVCIEGELADQHLIPRIGMMSYRRAWHVFHPDSQSIAAAR